MEWIIFRKKFFYPLNTNDNEIMIVKLDPTYAIYQKISKQKLLVTFTNIYNWLYLCVSITG